MTAIIVIITYILTNSRIYFYKISKVTIYLIMSMKITELNKELRLSTTMLFEFWIQRSNDLMRLGRNDARRFVCGELYIFAERLWTVSLWDKTIKSVPRCADSKSELLQRLTGQVCFLETLFQFRFRPTRVWHSPANMHFLI